MLFGFVTFIWRVELGAFFPRASFLFSGLAENPHLSA
jgi:hypothetical protein